MPDLRSFGASPCLIIKGGKGNQRAERISGTGVGSPFKFQMVQRSFACLV